MNGVHDLGGMHGFGSIHSEPGEPVFRHPWERRVFALTLACGPAANWTLDAERHASESITGTQYLCLSYYERWFVALQALLLRGRFLSERELSAGKVMDAARSVTSILKADGVDDHVRKVETYSRVASADAQFAPGQKVRARNMHPRGHTRLPRYVRGHIGTVAGVHGYHVFPDSNAHDNGECPRWLYSVSFTANEIWGGDQPPHTEIRLDLWEPYLEPA